MSDLLDQLADRTEQICELETAMQSAISLIDNGDSNKARAVLDGALGDLDDAN